MTPDELILRTLVFCLGGFLLLTSLQNIWSTFFIRKWPHTSGKINQSEIQIHSRKFDTGFFNVYEVHLGYEYEVAGENYQGAYYAFDQKRLDFFENHQDRAQHFQAQYPLESKVPVYYHPRRPTLAYLYPGVSLVSTPFFALLGSFVGLYFCGLMTFF